MEHLLQVQHLNKSYKKSNFHLKDISLTLQPGEVIGLIGKNGSGKSTLINTLVGNRFKDSGDISFLIKLSQIRIMHTKSILALYLMTYVCLINSKLKIWIKFLRIFSKHGTVIVSLKSFSVSNYQLTHKLRRSQDNAYESSLSHGSSA